jgi:spore germination protein GerM
VENPPIVAVRFLIDGQPQGVPGGGGEVIERPVNRSDYLEFVRPA